MLQLSDKVRKRHILLCFIAFGVFMQTYAQSNVRLNNFWDNLYSINPAYITNKYLGSIGIAARKQWMGFPGAPSTYLVTGTLVLDKLNTQFGVKAYEDMIGYTHTSSASLSYAYAVNLNDDWRLHLGVAASFQSLWYDMDMSIADATTILFGSSKTGATDYLKQNTNTQLAAAYKPKVEASLNKDLVGTMRQLVGLRNASTDNGSLFVPIFHTNLRKYFGFAHKQRFNQNEGFAWSETLI